jgi:hypothetical protein
MLPYYILVVHIEPYYILVDNIEPYYILVVHIEPNYILVVNIEPKYILVVNIEPNYNCQYQLSSSVRNWQNTFQQGVDICPYLVISLSGILMMFCQLLMQTLLTGCHYHMKKGQTENNSYKNTTEKTKD